GLAAVSASTEVRVEAHCTDNSVITYVDVNGDGAYTAGTDILVALVQNERHLIQGQDAGIILHGPGAMSTTCTDPASSTTSGAVYGNLDTLSDGGGVAIFNSDGSVVKSGSFRFRDQRGNILEVLVS